MGILAYFTLSLSMLLAIILKINPGAFPSLTRWHHEISIVSVVLSLLHAVNNILDTSIWGLGVERVFWFNLSNINAVWISLGVLSLYMMILLVATSFKAVMKKIKFPRWSAIHVTSYLLYFFVIVHSLLLGTDMNLLNSTNALELFVNFMFLLMAFANLIGMFLVFSKLKGVIKP